MKQFVMTLVMHNTSTLEVGILAPDIDTVVNTWQEVLLAKNLVYRDSVNLGTNKALLIRAQEVDAILIKEFE